MSKGNNLRKLLKENKCLTLPGVYDCVSALVAEKAGFECLFTSGFGISASSYGKPDYGLVSSTEMIGVIENIVNTINVPLVVDLDIRTVSTCKHDETASEVEAITINLSRDLFDVAVALLNLTLVLFQLGKDLGDP